MKNLFLFTFVYFQILACKTLSGDPSPQSNGASPEAGEYNSFDANIAPDAFKYNIKSNQWEWKWDTKLQLTPSAFGRLRINKNGTYEFLDLKESGTFKEDKSSKKLTFTGFMAGAEGYYKIKRGWCNLYISTKAKDGSTLSIVYEKKSDFPQPDVKDPNSSFNGTIVNMLSNSSADYIDVASGKTVKTHSNVSFPVTGSSKYSLTIYRKNYLDSDEIYPVIEIKDGEGNLIKKFEKTWRDNEEDKWDICDYWYGMLSPDGTKIALVGQYRRYPSFLDPKYKDPYPMVNIIDVKSGKEIYSYILDKNGNNWGPGWAPTGELVLPNKGGGINILDANLKNIKTIYKKNVSDARMNPFGKILFHEGTGLFTMDANGSNIEPVKIETGNLSIAKLYDLGWSPDGKSMAFVVEEYLKTYNVLLLNPVSKEFIYFSDSKGDSFQFNSPFLNWK